MNAQEHNQAVHPPRFLGSASCGSSSCHGGAATNRNQNLIWARHDFHTRSYATLTTARSERLAEALKVGEASKSLRCTVCHAPFHDVPASMRASEVRAEESVSCENCHGPAEGWLRTHTRADLTHRERVQAGMRDLKNLYVRANTCVACHQTVETDLLAAGHPELIFELDGQTVTEPKHWRETHEWIGPQAWLVGQAAALREMSWHLARDKAAPDRVASNWIGLLWLLQKTDGLVPSLPSLAAIPLEPTAENLTRTQQLSDELARKAAGQQWSRETARKYLLKLAEAHTDFTDKNTPPRIQARRAERLVLALDRLVVALSLARTDAALEARLNQLFKLVQSLPDFEPARFAGALEGFSKRLKETDLAK